MTTGTACATAAAEAAATTTTIVAASEEEGNREDDAARRPAPITGAADRGEGGGGGGGGGAFNKRKRNRNRNEKQLRTSYPPLRDQEGLESSSSSSPSSSSSEAEVEKPSSAGQKHPQRLDAAAAAAADDDDPARLGPRRRRGRRKGGGGAVGEEEEKLLTDSSNHTRRSQRSSQQQQQQQQRGASQSQHGTNRSSTRAGASTTSSAAVSSAKPWSLKAEGRLRGAIATLVLLGAAASASFLYLGMSASQLQHEDAFVRVSAEIVRDVRSEWDAYVNAGMWIHASCEESKGDGGGSSSNATISCSRSKFREIYERVAKGPAGVDVRAIGYAPKIVGADQRASLEAESRRYYLESYYPNEGEIDADSGYGGIVGYAETNGTATATGTEPSDWSVARRSDQPVYYPIHYVEPDSPENRRAALDFDLLSSEKYRAAVEEAIETWEPTVVAVSEMTASIFLGGESGRTKLVLLFHPGMELSTRPASLRPADVAVVAISVPELLRRAVAGRQVEDGNVEVYIFDSTDGGNGSDDDDDDDDDPEFLGGVRLVGGDGGGDGDQPQLLEESDRTELYELRRREYVREQTIQVTGKRRWTVVVVAAEGSFNPLALFVILGGAVLVVTPLIISLWMYTNARRVSKLNAMKATVARQKARLVCESAKLAAEAERELNDFIAHEVRNPLAAAMFATSFVKASVGRKDPLSDEESREATREDIEIIDTSLRYVNDLLRNMLEMHRAASNQIALTFEPTAVLSDVLEPIDSMVYRRGGNFKVIVDCQPPNLTVLSDKLRLKQVMLNLARNSTKFVPDEGFIKIRAWVNHEGKVRLSVEDNGPGIPLERRDRLFCKYTESLDSLRQGTGVGLFLCKNLVDLMDGKIWLDENYHSGVEGRMGTRFVVDLDIPPLDFHPEDDDDDHEEEEECNHHSEKGTAGAGAKLPESFQTVKGILEDSSSGAAACSSSCGTTSELSSSQAPPSPLRSPASPKTAGQLPERLKVLFVDDDMVLRKLFCRTVRKVAPTWDVREAASGERALKLVEEDDFDLIFMDMYMASIEKQLLGSETVALLRSQGIQCRICGLSANDVEKQFLQSGADTFTFKPFPCKAGELTNELLRILYGTTSTETPKQTSVSVRENKTGAAFEALVPSKSQISQLPIVTTPIGDRGALSNSTHSKEGSTRDVSSPNSSVSSFVKFNAALTVIPFGGDNHNINPTEGGAQRGSSSAPNATSAPCQQAAPPKSTPARHEGGGKRTVMDV